MLSNFLQRKNLASFSAFEDETAVSTPQTANAQVFKGIGIGAELVAKKTLVPFGQGSLRTYAGLGAFIANKIGLSETAKLTPRGTFQKELFGTDQPISLRSVGEEIPGLKGKKVAPLVGFALGLSDLIPGGGADDAFKAIAKINKTDDIAKLLTRLKVPANQVDDLARVLTNVDQVDDVKRLISESMKLTDKVSDAATTKGVAKGTAAVIKAFENSSGQIPLAKVGDTTFELGSFGKNALLRKVNQADRLNVNLLPETLENLKNVFQAGSPGKSYRGGNLVWIADVGDEARAIVTRKNANGAEEIINFFKIGKDKTNFIANLGGVPSQTRTGTTNLEGLRSILLTDRDMSNVIKSITSVKERGFITSVKELLPEADKVAGQYVPRSTDELAMKARNLIKDNIYAAEKMATTGTDEKAVAVASELIKYYGDEAAKSADDLVKAAFYDKAADIANTIAPKLTEQGRAIQAASILGRLTPEGQIRFAAREIQRFNELNPTKAIPELSGEQASYIGREMKEIMDMADGTDKAIRFQKLQEYMLDLMPTPLTKKVIAVWKAGLLTGFKTHGLNLFSNLSHGVTEIVKDAPAAAVDNVASLFTGTRTKTFTLQGVPQGVQEGFEKGLRYWKTGFDERNIASKLEYQHVNFGSGMVAKAFKTYTDMVFRALGISDQPFYYGALSRSLWDQGLAQAKNAGMKGDAATDFARALVSEPTEDMIRYAVVDATTAVFQNKTTLGKWASQIQRAPLGELVLPFGRTPSAVAMQIINYSPVGIAKTIFENIGKGKFDQRLFSQGIGRGLTGTAVIAIGMALAKKGLVSLDYPKGDEREQGLQEAEGTKPNSVLIDDKWRSPIVLGPAGNLLLVGGHFQDALEKSGSPSEALALALAGSAKSFTEQTFLTGLEDVINALTDPERYAKSYLPNLLASFVPTLVSDVARATDPLERRSGGTGIVDMTANRISSRIPGLRRQLEAQIDILGNQRESVGNSLEIMFDPTRPSPSIKDPVLDELRRLMDIGYRVSPTKLGDRDGYDVLTEEENSQLWARTGEILSGKLNNLFRTTEYGALSDEEKAKAVDDFVAKTKDISRAEMVLKVTEGLQGNALKEKLSELKTGGLLTQSVFKTVEGIRDFDFSEPTEDTQTKLQFSIASDVKDVIKQSTKSFPGKVAGYVAKLFRKLGNGEFKKNVKTMLAETYPMTDEAMARVDDIEIHNIKPVNILGSETPIDEDLPPGVGGYFQPATSISGTADGAINRFANVFYNLGAENIADGLREILDPEELKIVKATPSVLSHEVIHALVDEDLNTAAVNQAWHRLLQGEAGPGIQKFAEDIDQHIDTNYENKSARSYAHERLAYFGEAAGVYGLSGMPEIMRPFYVGIFKEESPNVPEARTPAIQEYKDRISGLRSRTVALPKPVKTTTGSIGRDTLQELATRSF